MVNTKKAILVIAIIALTSSINAQSDFSIQLNSGISKASKSGLGFSGLLQLNYSLNSNFDLYLYSGYSSIDKSNPNNFRHDDFNVAESRHSTDIIEGDYNVVPIYLGGSLDLFETEWIKTFTNLEVGYSRLSFNTYDRMIPVYSDEGEVKRFSPDRSTAEKHNENLFGAGFGLGASHPLTNSLEVLLTFKLNTSTNFEEMNMFSRRSTYTSLLAGINYRL